MRANIRAQLNATATATTASERQSIEVAHRSNLLVFVYYRSTTNIDSCESGRTVSWPQWDCSDFTSTARDSCCPTASCSNASENKKAAYVINELLSTEEAYVEELSSVAAHYVNVFDEIDCLHNAIPEKLIGQQEVIFGNLTDILHFHEHIFLPELRQCAGNPYLIARTFLRHRGHFYLYNIYCQNKPQSASLRERYSGCDSFFNECQEKAGHRLPLEAYLLKPVQRITKYHLLLRIRSALKSMLELLQQLNASLHQCHISGYPGDFSTLGQLLMQGRFSVWIGTKKSADKALRILHQRHVFLYPHNMLLCKLRRQSMPFTRDYYEFKEEIPVLLHLEIPTSWTSQISSHSSCNSKSSRPLNGLRSSIPDLIIR
ncbi:unnamed protein product [Soboliphyme baturini]|uniref:DH domain-containing protein n=1 Tax=Soboliphyme baturini TaxID=241478 RepID=A0A183INB4_9BILA|nr:unnamed protein product [Soboliphyme baturini]